MSLNGRVLQCAGCDAFVRAYEAVLGAKTDAEHEYLNPDDYLCGQCEEIADRIAHANREEVAI